MTQIQTWMKGTNRDREMNEYHEQFWRTFIDRCDLPDLSQATALDFGCGCGGFLRMLHDVCGFKRGIGLDIAVDSVEIARKLKGGLPIDYHVATEAPDLADSADYAFSYEVIYLLPDLEQHAQFLHRVLKRGGAYFAATGCHTANPLWEAWRPLVESQSNLPVPSYSPEDFAEAFSKQGFAGSVRRLDHDDFVPLDLHKDHFPTAEDVMRYYRDDILVFRFEKR